MFNHRFLSRSLPLAITLVAYLMAGLSVAQPHHNLPDLVVTSISLTPEFPEANDIVEVHITVLNNSDAPSPAARLVLRVNGTIWSAQNTPSLDANEATDVAFTWVATKGRQVLEAHINAFDDIQESDINNNVFERVVEFTPDLLIESVELSPKNPQPGQATAVSITVRNVGGKPTDTSAALRFKVGRSVLGTFFVQPLAPGQRKQLTTRWRPETGEHVLRFEVDALEIIAESDEFNNAVSGIINISSTPPTGANLMVRSLTVAPEEPAPHAWATISATVANIGNGPAALFEARFEVDGAELTALAVPSLAAGESAVVSAQWRPRAGERVVRVKLDQPGIIIESSESDNTRSQIFKVGQIVNDCTQVVFLELEANAVPLIASSLGLSDDSVRNNFLPKVKTMVERDFEGVNLALTLQEPNITHSRLRLLAESRYAILGSAPLDLDNRNPSDVGSLFLGSFAGLGGGRPLNHIGVDQIVQAIANTASHELGHLLGLKHDEPQNDAYTSSNLMAPDNEAATFFQDAAFTKANLDYLKHILPFKCDAASN